jgi:hypothetical protein
MNRFETDQKKYLDIAVESHERTLPPVSPGEADPGASDPGGWNALAREAARIGMEQTHYPDGRPGENQNPQIARDRELAAAIAAGTLTINYRGTPPGAPGSYGSVPSPDLVPLPPPYSTPVRRPQSPIGKYPGVPTKPWTMPEGNDDK